MLKAKAGSIVFLGLTPENIDRLEKGYPIWVKQKDLELEVDIVIFFGETNEHLQDELKTKLNLEIGPTTIIKDSRPKKH